MKNLKLNLFAILLAGLTVGCSDHIKYETTRWSRLSSASSEFADSNSQNYNLKINKKDIQFQQQFIQGVEVENSYRKNIVDGEQRFASSNWIEQVPVSLRVRILLMKLQSSFIKSAIQNKHSQLNLKNLYEKPKLILQGDNLLWKLVVTSPDGKIEGLFFDSRMNLVRRQILGSGGGLAEATIFPQGPLKSQLQNVILHELAQNKTLNIPLLKVSTQSHDSAYSENSQFRYSVEDHRFEQVQVFYYIAKALKWVESELLYQLPYQLEVETFVGFPEKTNTAFYYQRKIRLGEGDGATFDKIPLDPSLVIHETFHSIIDPIARLPFQGEGGALNEAFADFFTAIFLENPNMGEVSYKMGPYKRTVNNKLKLQDKNGGLYHDSGIISGLLWDLSRVLGRDKGLKISWEVLVRMNPTSVMGDFYLELTEVLTQLPLNEQQMAQRVLMQRGWVP